MHRILVALICALTLTLSITTLADGNVAGVRPATGKTRGTVVVIHGGAWLFTGPDMVATAVAVTGFLPAAGYKVVDLDYLPGNASLISVIADLKALGPDVCLWGVSAGGNLALLAAQQLRVACVIARSAPTDLGHLAADKTPDLQDAAVKLLGDLPAWSPALHPWPKKTPLLLHSSPCDPIVGANQNQRMAKTARRAKAVTVVLSTSCRKNGVQLSHSFVAPAGVKTEEKQEVAFLRKYLPAPKKAGR